jgi:hypothetical protein
MADTKYNGWTNYETWNVALWLDNNEGDQNYWNETAQEVYDAAEAEKSFTRDEQATLDLMHRLQEEIEEAQPDLGASMWADLLGAAMSEVNWYEIAEHYIAEVDKETEDKEA